jgi:glycosyltransferase involved in cell wall biosynthesis
MASLNTALRQAPAARADRSGNRWQGCVSVIVPVYNEVEHVEELVQAIHAAPVKKEIILVDDGSTDGTREKLRAMPAVDGMTIVFHEKNCGKGAAIRTALAYAHGEYVLIQDSDLEYDPQDYPAAAAGRRRGERCIWRTAGSPGARVEVFSGREAAHASCQLSLWSGDSR